MKALISSLLFVILGTACAGQRIDPTINDAEINRACPIEGGDAIDFTTIIGGIIRDRSKVFGFGVRLSAINLPCYAEVSNLDCVAEAGSLICFISQKKTWGLWPVEWIEPVTDQPLEIAPGQGIEVDLGKDPAEIRPLACR